MLTAGAGSRGAVYVPTQLPSTGLFSNLELIRKLGSGGYGVVGEYETKGGKSGGKRVAIKSVECHPLNANLLRELETLTLNHPNLLSFSDVFAPPGEKQVHIRLPIAAENDLFHNMYRLSDLSMAQFLGLVYQILCGVTALHNLNLYHFDLKPNNILVTFWPPEEDKKNFPRIQIADPGLVGWSRSALPESPHQLITVSHRPPEMLCPQKDNWNWKPSEKADVFSLGVTLLQLIEGRLLGSASEIPPWFEGNVDTEKEQIARNLFEKYSSDSSQVWMRECPMSKREEKEARRALEISDWFQRLLPEVSQPYSSLSDTYKLLLPLIRRMLSFNPNDRPTVKECLTEIVKMYTTLKIPKLHLPSCPLLKETLYWQLFNARPSREGKTFQKTVALLQPFYNKLKQNFLTAHENKLSPETKALIQSELDQAVRTVALFKLKNPTFPKEKLPIVFLLFVLWIAPRLDDLLQTSLCESFPSQEEDLTQFAYDLLRHNKLISH